MPKFVALIQEAESNNEVIMFHISCFKDIAGKSDAGVRPKLEGLSFHSISSDTQSWLERKLWRMRCIEHWRSVMGVRHRAQMDSTSHSLKHDEIFLVMTLVLYCLSFIKGEESIGR